MVYQNKFHFTSKREMVYKILRDRITSGQYQADKIYKVVELAEELGVSRTPISEAVKILASQGYVTLLPSVGFEIKKLSKNEVQEILLIRGKLEKLAIEVALKTAKPESLNTMKKILEECELAVKENDILEYVRLNEEFHFVLFEMAKLPRLTKLLQNLWTNEGWINQGLKDKKEPILEILKDHHIILEILENKDMGKYGTIDEVLDSHIKNCIALHDDQVLREEIAYALAEKKI